MKWIARPSAARMAFILWLLALAACGSGAEPQAPRAVLERGPMIVKGIPFLPPNVLPAVLGEYSLGEERISVLFSAEELVLPREWKSLRCDGLRLLEVPEDSGRTLCLVEEAAQPLFFFFRFKNFEADGCRFIKAFRARFLQLRGYSSGGEEVFPAILELGS